MTHQASEHIKSAYKYDTYNEVERLTNDAGNPAKNRETYVDEEISTATCFKKNGERRKEDCYDVGKDVGLGLLGMSLM